MARLSGGTVDMTAGRPLALILRLGLPLIAANTLQQVYSMVDTVILGRFCGTSGLAVLGVCSWPVWLQVSILTNFSQAASIVLAKRFGAGEGEALRAAAGNVYAMSLALLVGLTLALQACTEPLLTLIGAPAQAMADAQAYLRITYAGTAVVLAYNVFSAFLRAVGDGATPMRAIAAATLVNLALDVLFVARMGWGAPGAAVATVIAQGVSALVCMRRVLSYGELRVQKRHLRLQGEVVREYVSLSVPMLLQSFVIAFGGFFVQNHINAYGEAFVAGMSATNKIFGLLETAAISLAQATASFVGQNLGARRFARIRSGTRASVAVSLGIAAALAGAMGIFGRALLSLFVAEEAIGTAWGLLMTMSAGLFIMYPMYVLRQSLQALGNAFIPLVAALIQLAARVLVTLLLPLLLGEKGLYFPTVVAWLTSLVLIGAVWPRWLARCEREAL